MKIDDAETPGTATVYDDETLVIVSYHVVPYYPPVLTASEREIVLAIMQGQSNADIARARSTSTNTVANQIAAIFAKTKVNSRAELAAKLHRACVRCERVSLCDECPAAPG